MKELKRRQFLSFFTDFFEKYKKGSPKFDSSGIRFQDKEQARLLDKYFKKYYMENNRLPTTREISVNKIRAARKAAAKIEKVERQVDSVANENKFALLGKSEGVQNAFTTSEVHNELADVLEQRQNKSMKKPKALVHGMGLKTQN